MCPSLLIRLRERDYRLTSQRRVVAEVLEGDNVHLDGRSGRYDPDVVPGYHHLVCDTCGTVYDVQHQIEAPPLSDRQRHGMVIRRSDVVHRGTCDARRDRESDA